MTPPLLAMLNTPEIIALLVLALILFGAKKLPELARGLGHGIKEFRKATRDVTDELQSAMDVNSSPPPPRHPSQPTYPEPTYPGGSSPEMPSEPPASTSPTEQPADPDPDKPATPS